MDTNALLPVAVFVVLGLLVLAVLGGLIAMVLHLVNAAVAAERQRSLAMQQVAAQCGWSFDAVVPALSGEVAGFKLFSRGRGRHLTNALRGQEGGIPVSLVDYRYTMGSGRNSKTYHMTVCAVRVDGARLPHLFVRPQLPFLDSLGRVLGGQDIDFPDDLAFSSAFVVQTNGTVGALRLRLTPEVRAHLRSLGAPQVEARATSWC